MMKHPVRWTSVLLMPAVGLSLVSLNIGPAQAQNPPAKPHKKSFAQRHPTATSAAAGYAAYKVAKTTGKNRARAGRKRTSRSAIRSPRVSLPPPPLITISRRATKRISRRLIQP